MNALDAYIYNCAAIQRLWQLRHRGSITRLVLRGFIRNAKRAKEQMKNG